MGFRLARGRYARIKPIEGASLPSRRLGVWLVAQGSELRVIDPATGEMVQTRLERIERVEDERDRAQEALEQAQREQREERQRRLRSERATRQAEADAQQARDRVREVEAELRRLRGLPPGEGS